MTSRPKTTGINRTSGTIQKTKPTGTSKTTETFLITSRYNEKRIDDIYSKIKNFLTKYKGNPKENLLAISEELYYIIYEGKDPGYNNNLYNLEVLLAVLRYLSRTKKPYNKRRIALLSQFIFVSEQNAHTNVFKYAGYTTKATYVTVTDTNYYEIAKKYLKKINEKFNVDTRLFTDNDGLYRTDKFFEDPKNKYSVNFISNTYVRILIDKILKKDLELLPDERLKTESRSSTPNRS